MSLQARLLPQGTQLCPLCGDAFPLHADATIAQCNRCRASVTLVSSSSSQSNPIEAMKAMAAKANQQWQRLSVQDRRGEGGAAAGGAAAFMEKTKQDLRQVEDALCEKCGAVRKCFTHALQIRGADEGQTIFYECSSCKYKWSLNS